MQNNDTSTPAGLASRAMEDRDQVSANTYFLCRHCVPVRASPGTFMLQPRHDTCSYLHDLCVCVCVCVCVYRIYGGFTLV